VPLVVRVEALVVEGFDPANELHQLSRRIMDGGWRSQHFAAIGKVLDELA